MAILRIVCRIYVTYCDDVLPNCLANAPDSHFHSIIYKRMKEEKKYNRTFIQYAKYNINSNKYCIKWILTIVAYEWSSEKGAIPLQIDVTGDINANICNKSVNL